MIRLQLWYIVCWKTLALTSLLSKAIQVLPLFASTGLWLIFKSVIPIYPKGNFACLQIAISGLVFIIITDIFTTHRG